jgi:hypothetical protein
MHVEWNGGQITRLAEKQGDDAVECPLHVGRRRRFARGWKSPDDTRARFVLARLGQLHARDATLTPGDTASTNRRIEEREAVGRDGSLLRDGLRPGDDSCDVRIDARLDRTLRGRPFRAALFSLRVLLALLFLASALFLPLGERRV